MNRNFTWNVRSHGLYVPGLLIWGTVIAEVLIVAMVAIYAAARFVIWTAVNL